MRKLLFGFASMIVLLPSATAADLTIAITNITEATGKVRWVVFDSEANYQSDANPVHSASSRVNGEGMKFTLHELPAGQYAIKLYHDANDNGELDSNMLGIPTEGYGFSNNAGRFGPPSFEDAAVALEDDLAIEIRVR